MASSKKLTYKVETKLVTERKRRRSDLVILWQSIWDVTTMVIKDLWITVYRTWEYIQLWFNSSERVLVLKWLEKYLPYVPEDFSESWRDGRLLAILLNKLRPGCFPDANKLDPEYGLKNVYRVFDALEIYFEIKPKVSVEEIVTCIDGSDAKLFEILLELKNFTDKCTEQQDYPALDTAEKEQSVQRPSSKECCIAKGTGLIIGFVGKTAKFAISCAVMSNLDVVVEIRGPNSICSERITKRSPKKKHSTPSWECARYLTRSSSFSEDSERLVSEDDDKFEKRIILLEYEIIGDQIIVSYKPKEKGKHKVTILWHGQHLTDSPYFVTVKDPSDLTGINTAMHLKPALKSTSEYGKDEISDKSRTVSVRFQESTEKCKVETKHASKIVSRRVLRYIVKIQGRDIPVNAENTESLATELLKMDYDFEKSPSFHRRNSWGFVGDAERKKSVIRQFCVDVKELDAQISQRRSRSLSSNSGSKKLMRKSDSFESLATNLNIVCESAECTFESAAKKSRENEADYAYINEDDCETDLTKVKYDSEVLCLETAGDKTTKLSSELTKRKFAESLKEKTGSETEADKISSSSIRITSKKQINDSNRELQSILPPRSPVLKSNVDNLNEIFTHKYSDTEVHNEDKSTENEQNDSGAERYFQTSTSKKMPRKNSKRKNYIRGNQTQSRVFKKCRIKIRTANFPEHTYYRNVIRKKESSPPVSIFRKRQGKSRQLSRVNKIVVSKQTKILGNHKIKESVPERDAYKYGNDTQYLCVEMFHNSQLEQNAVSGVNNELLVKENCTENTEKNKLSEVDNNDRKVIQKEQTICDASKNLVQDFKAKRLDIDHNLNTVQTMLSDTKIKSEERKKCKTKPLKTFTLKPVEQFFINHSFSASPTNCKKSETEIKSANNEPIKPLRTHTLKSIGEYNFKQFNLSFETQDSISPIKVQIGQWENTLLLEKQNATSHKIHKPDTEQVNVKEKLAFWENAYKTEQQGESNKKLDLIKNKKSCKLTQVSSDFQKKDNTADNKTRAITSFVNEEIELYDSINKETNMSTKKQTDDKISVELQRNSENKRRCFSDPVILEATPGESDISENFSCLESSKNVYSGSSTDDNLEHYDSDDSGDSGGDYISQSTVDEYIDDEISENATEYWGDMTIVKGWKTAQCANEYVQTILEEEFLQNCQRNKSYPEQCKVFGIAVYYGHVAVKNRFQVYTGDAGFGNLSVSMQGFRRHDVSLISVAYLRNDIYEVIYQVMTAGYYLISIRWMDKEIPGNPFVCKVTF